MKGLCFAVLLALPFSGYSAEQQPNYTTQRPPIHYAVPGYYRPMILVQPPGPVAAPPTILLFRDGQQTMATDYWFEGGKQFRYVTLDGSSMVVSVALLDMPATVKANRTQGVIFTLRSAGF